MAGVVRTHLYMSIQRFVNDDQISIKTRSVSRNSSLYIAHTYTLYIIAQTDVLCNSKIALAISRDIMYNTYNY